MHISGTVIYKHDTSGYCCLNGEPFLQYSYGVTFKTFQGSIKIHILNSMGLCFSFDLKLRPLS